MQTRCECRDLSFAGLLAYARRQGIKTVEELIKATGCCTGCGRCRPLLEELLRSGKLRVGDLLIDLPPMDSDLPPQAFSARDGRLASPGATGLDQPVRQDQEHEHRDEDEREPM